MENHFRKFGVDIVSLCHDLGQLMGDLLPDDFDELRPFHIQQLMVMLDQETVQFFALNSMLVPRVCLNQDGQLQRQIWRFVEFRQATEALANTVVRALTLRQPLDVIFDEDRQLVLSQPKIRPEAFRGVSCFLQFPLPGCVLHRQETLPSKKDLSALEQRTKQATIVSKVRSVVGLYLDVHDMVPSIDWIVDADDTDPGHVTVAVANPDGLRAVAPPDLTNKVRVPALLDLPWKLRQELLILKAEAEWRDDFLPNDDRWSNIVAVLNEILAYGDMDDFLSVWSIHEMIHTDRVGADLRRNLFQPLHRIQTVLQSFEMSDQHDINEPARPLYRAMADVRTLIESAERTYC